MSRRIMLVAIVSVLALAVAGCAPRAAAPPPQEVYREAEAPAMEEEVVEKSLSESSGAAADYASIERLIVRNASLDLVVADTETALEQINALVDELGGYIVSSNVYQYQEGLQASVTFRIPAESLDVALARIRSLATEVRSENISGQDVTKDYVNLNSRLRHLEATEARLTEFLEDAEDTEAALAVYEKLSEVEAEIERVKGEMQYLEESVAMSSVSLSITPDELAQPIQVGGWHPEGTLRNALQSLIRVFQFLVDALIVIVVLVIPAVIAVAVPFAVVFFVVRAVVRRRRARKKAQS